MLGQQSLQMSFHAVLDQAGVNAQFVARIVLDLLDRDAKLLPRLVLDHPHRDLPVGLLDEPARRAHPVQGLIGTIVGMHAHRAIGLEQQQSFGRREMSCEPTDVIDGALSDDEPHRTTIDGGLGITRLTPR